MRMGSLLLLTLLPLCSCASVPTPSGRPELRVSVPPSESKARIVNAVTERGYMVTASDDVGVSATKPFAMTMLNDAGAYLLRVNLMPEPPAGTRIRGTIFVQQQFQGQVDDSAGRAGLAIQGMLERAFADCMVDGPFIKPESR